MSDESGAEGLADEWLGRGWSFPLWFVEGDGGVPATIARVILRICAAALSLRQGCGLGR